MRKYNQLVLDLEEGKHNGVKWNAQLLCVEIGARGALHEMAWGRACVELSVLQKQQERRWEMRCKMLPFSAAISSFPAATTKSGNLKRYEMLGCPLKRATQLHQRWLALRLVVRAASLRRTFEALKRVPIKTAALLF